MLTNYIDFDQSAYEIPFDNDDYIFNPPQYDETQKNSKTSNDEQDFQSQRRDRILKKRIERKNKKPNNETSASQTLSKEEIRKQRNRNSAQMSRDKKKAQQMMIQEENDELKKIILEKDIHISALIEENNKLIQRLQFLEDIHNGQLNQSTDQTEMVRVNVYTKKHLMNYGLLALLSVACVMSVLSLENTVAAPVYFKQIEQPSYSQDFLERKIIENQNFNYIPNNQTSISPLRNNHLAIPDQTQFNQTLFFNCTAGEQACENFLDIISAENADNVFFVNDPPQTSGYRNISHKPEIGDKIFLVKIQQDDEDNFMIFRAKCSITESSQLFIEKENYNSLY